MKKAAKSTVIPNNNETNGASYSLRKRPAANTSKEKFKVKKTDLNVKKTDKKVTEAKSKTVTRRSNRMIKPNLIKSPTKKLTVLSTKIRAQRTVVVSTPKTMILGQKTPITKNNKTNESAIKTKEVSTVSKPPVEIVTPQLPKITVQNVSVRLKRLSERLQNKYGKDKAKTAQKTLKDNKIKEINSTPPNKNQSIKNKSAKPTRVLRKRNKVIPNRYKDATLDSPIIKKSVEPTTPNPLAVYEFEFDPTEEQIGKNKIDSDSSGAEDNEMREVLKKLRKTHKKVIKKANQKQKRAEKQKKVEQVNEEPDKTKQDQEEEKQLPTNIINNLQPIIAPEKQNTPEKVLIKPQPEINNELPQLSLNSVEMVSISDYSDPLDPISPRDPSIQARNIVDEVTKSFIDDLSDEESNSFSPGRINILSNIVIRTPKTPKNKNNIFNSTMNGLKASTPWRIDVSAIRRKPYIFTYKDKSFTPRYDREIVTVPQSNLNEIDQNQENIKPTYQTSILDFVKSSNPKLENKISGLFNDAPRKPVQSPRKVLGEINFLQSTPLKPHNNLNILKSPNISFITPQKKLSDSMFGFSYFSDDEENKENVRKSPRKLSPKKNNPINEIVKQTVPIIEINDETIDKAVKTENLTVTEADISAEPIDSDLSVNLFQDIELNVSKKTTRTYVRKNPKRKRLPSVDTIPSDDEYEPEVKKKHKQKNVLTKKEEMEVDRLAAHYNSMFEEIENYPLIIE